MQHVYSVIETCILHGCKLQMHPEAGCHYSLDWTTGQKLFPFLDKIQIVVVNIDNCICNTKKSISNCLKCMR